VSGSKVKVIGQSSRSQEEHVANMVGSTSSEGFLVTFRVRRSRGEMHIGHGRLSVCLSVAAFPYTTARDPGVTLGMVGGAL